MMRSGWMTWTGGEAIGSAEVRRSKEEHAAAK